jgi:hypothetical protein
MVIKACMGLDLKGRQGIPNLDKFKITRQPLWLHLSQNEAFGGLGTNTESLFDQVA